MEKLKNNADLKAALALVLDLLGQEEPKEAAPDPAPVREGYYLATKIRGDKCHVYLLKDGYQVSSGFSTIKDTMSEDLAMAQAFSYAAHMCFKHLQWREEFEKNDAE